MYDTTVGYGPALHYCLTCSYGKSIDITFTLMLCIVINITQNYGRCVLAATVISKWLYMQPFHGLKKHLVESQIWRW